MGKRKGHSSESLSNCNSDSSEGYKSLRFVSSASGNSFGSSLSGLSRKFGSKKFKFNSSSSSSNNGSQLSDIVAKYVCTPQTKDCTQNTNQDSTGIKPTSGSGDQITGPFGKYEHTALTTDCTQNTNQRSAESITSPRLSGYGSQLVKILKEDINLCSKNIEQKDHLGKLCRHSTPKLSFSDDMFFDELNCTGSIREHFSQLPSDLIGEINISKETCYDNSETSAFSNSKEFGELLGADDLLVIENFHEEANKITQNSEIPQSNCFATYANDSQENGQTNCLDNDLNFEEYLKDISIASSEKIKIIQDQGEVHFGNTSEPFGFECDTLSIASLNNSTTFMKILTEGEKECSENETCVEEYLENVSVTSSEKVQILPFDEPNLELEVSRLSGDNLLSNSLLAIRNEAEKCQPEFQKEYLESESSHKCLQLEPPAQAVATQLDSRELDQDVYNCLAFYNFSQTFLSVCNETDVKLFDDLKNEDHEDNLEDCLNDISLEDLDKLNSSVVSEILSTGSKNNFSDADKRLREGINRISKDKSLTYSGANVLEDPNLGNRKRVFIKGKIELILGEFVQDMSKGRHSVFTYRNNISWNNAIYQNNVLKLIPAHESSIIQVSNANRWSRRNFNLILYLLMKCYVLLQTDSCCTHREIYYQIKNFCKTPAKIRAAMNTISSMLNIEPWYFPIVPTSSGLVFGDLTVVVSPEEILSCNAFGGTLIPYDVTRIREFKSKAYFILVVEKDAIFKKLLDENIPNKLTRPFIMVTGKGYPDTNTRLFIKKLWMHLRIPVFILVDGDPDGINIMLTYRFGSLNMAHVSEELALPHMRWLGVFPSEINKFKFTQQFLTDLEKTKVEGILKRPYTKHNSWLQEELETLRKNNFKCGIESAIKSSTFLTDVYLPFKFYSHNYF